MVRILNAATAIVKRNFDFIARVVAIVRGISSIAAVRGTVGTTINASRSFSISFVENLTHSTHKQISKAAL